MTWVEFFFYVALIFALFSLLAFISDQLERRARRRESSEMRDESRAVLREQTWARIRELQR